MRALIHNPEGNWATEFPIDRTQDLELHILVFQEDVSFKIDGHDRPIEMRWSLFESDPWLAYVATQPPGHAFQTVAKLPLSDRTAFITWQPFHLQGEDYEVNVKRVVDLEESGTLNGPLLDQPCV
jgi:hypothetical protein